VTVALPSVGVPLPTSPELRTPALAAPSPVQAPSAATPAVPTVPSVSSVTDSAPGGSSAGSAPGSSSAGSSSSEAASTPYSDRPKVERFRSARSWIATSGPMRRRVTTLTFVLPSAARVLFVVKQVSPLCKIADRFAVYGHAGLNRIRFPRPASRPQLEPGTYRITARTLAGRVVRRITIVVVDRGAPTREQIAAARASNVCGAAGRLAAAASGSTGASNTSSLSSSQQRSFTPAQLPGQNTHSGAVLAASAERAARAIRPVIVALLAIAIVLLAIASLRPVAHSDSRANEVIGRHRVEIAGLGAAAFVAVLIALVLG
jgi:hypothetical protein